MKLKLVPYGEAVFRKLYEWQCDDEMRKDMGGLSVPMTEQELFRAYQQFMGGNAVVLGVEETTTKNIVGAFICEDVQIRHKRLKAHIVFDKKSRHLVKEGLTLFGNYVFNENGFETIYVELGETQHHSINLVEKCGFIKRSVLPQHFNYSGEWVNGLLYSLPKSKRKGI